MIALTHDPIDHCSLTERVRRPGCGAVVTFLGTVRDLTGDKITVALDIVLVHRLGHLTVGAISVAVAVSCPHRADAFAACRHAIDRLKELVPLWKKENWADGASEWVHPERSPEP
jgi:molybdopterin synthase catalytic subunit